MSKGRGSLFLLSVSLFAALLPAGAGAQIVGDAAEFSFEPATPKAGETVQFTDESTGFVFGWYWSFGDGASDGSQSPAHAYAAPGVYAVTLSVITRDGTQLAVTHVVNVSAGGSTTADFAFDPPRPFVGQAVTFTDLSSGSPTAWSWDFGDGATSTQRNPVHAFTSAGAKGVRLTASSAGGPSSVTKSVPVSPTPLEAAFAFFPSNPVAGQSVSFTDSSAGNPTSWSWSFGDGATSVDRNPVHAYSAAGTYSVRLTIGGGGATDSETKSLAVTAAPTGSFGAKILSLAEVSFVTSNGNRVAEPGERATMKVVVSNSTSRTQPGVFGTVTSKTPGITMGMDQVGYGNVAAGASAAPPGVPFDFWADASVPCGATLSFDLKLAYGGLPATVLPLTTTLGKAPCSPPATTSPTLVLEDSTMAGASYRINAPIAFSYVSSGSVSVTGYRAELSRDGGVTWEALPTAEAPGVGPHISSFVATGPETTKARLRVTATLANGGTVVDASSASFTITSDARAAGVARLPVVVQSPGAAGTYFTTEATIATPDRAAAVQLTFTPTGGAPVSLATPILVRRGTRFLPDVFQPFRDQGLLPATSTPLVGTMTATLNGVTKPVVLARVVNVPSNGVGTFGLSFLSRLEGAAFAREAWVSGLPTSDQYRSNISFAHAGGGSRAAIGLKLELFEARTGRSPAGSPWSLVLPPDGFAQINNFQGFGVSPGDVYLCRVTRTSGDDQFRVYGTVIDAVTGDSSFVDGAAPYADGAAAVHVPSVVEAAGQYGAFFTSEAAFVNRSAGQGAAVSLHLDTSQGAFDIPSAFTLPPRNGLVIPDVVQYFREHGAAFGGTVVGPLTATFSGGDGDVAVRTFSARVKGQPSSGTFGLAYAGRRDDQAAGGGVLLVGATKSSAVRTNLSLVNTGTAPVTLAWQLVTSAFYVPWGPAASVPLAPGGFFQVNDVIGTSVSSGVPAPAGEYFVLVSRTAGSGPWQAYLTIIDNVTNDGSFVEMAR